MKKFQVRILGRVHNTLVKRILKLAGEDVEEVLEVLRLLPVPRVARAVGLHLLDEGELLLVGEVGDLRLHLRPVVEDILGGELTVEGLHEVDEGGGGLGAHEPDGHVVEEAVRSPSLLLEGAHPHRLQALVQHRPGPTRGGHLAGLDLAEGAEVVRVLADEVDDDPVDASVRRPGEPVGRGGLEVDGPEAVEEGRVHIRDLVVAAHVRCRDDLGSGVEADGQAVGTRTELAVEDDLEEGVLDPDEATVDLVEEEDAGLLGGPDVPGGEGEAGAPGGLRELEVGEAEHVALRGGGGPEVDEGLSRAVRELADDVALSDAVVTTDEDRRRRRHTVENFHESLCVQDFTPFLWEEIFPPHISLLIRRTGKGRKFFTLDVNYFRRRAQLLRLYRYLLWQLVLKLLELWQLQISSVTSPSFALGS